MADGWVCSRTGAIVYSQPIAHTIQCLMGEIVEAIAIPQHYSSERLGTPALVDSAGRTHLQSWDSLLRPFRASVPGILDERVAWWDRRLLYSAPLQDRKRHPA